MAIDGFYFLDSEIKDEKDKFLSMTAVYNTVMKDKVYVELLGELGNHIDINKVYTTRIGSINGNMELSISYTDVFEKCERKIKLGKIGSSLRDMRSYMKTQLMRSSKFTIGRVPDQVALFFDVFKKDELKTITNVKKKISLFEKMENFLNNEERELIMKLSKVHCMSLEEATKNNSLFQKLFRIKGF